MVSVSGNVEYKPYSNQAAITVGPDPKAGGVENIRSRQAPAPSAQDTGGKPSALRDEQRKPDVEFRSKPSSNTAVAANSDRSERGSVLDVVV